jgi:hypothetical protein
LYFCDLACGHRGGSAPLFPDTSGARIESLQAPTIHPQPQRSWPVENLQKGLEPWQSVVKVWLHSTGDASPRAALLLPQILPDILGRRALPAGRLACLGATPDFHHGLLAKRFHEVVDKVVEIPVPLAEILDLSDGMDHGRMVLSPKAASDLGQRRARESLAEVHRNLPRHRD